MRDGWKKVPVAPIVGQLLFLLGFVRQRLTVAVTVLLR